MKIQDLPVELLQDAMLALQDLRRKYLSQPMITEFSKGPSGCPLCEFDIKNSDSIDLDPDQCCLCPWEWFTEMTCLSGLHKYNPNSPRLVNTELTMLDVNLYRIDLWEHYLVEELAARRTSTEP